MNSRTGHTTNRFNSRTIEQLEQRVCLDGGVQVVLGEVPGYHGLTAIVTGDELDNSVRVQQLAQNSYSIQGAFFGASDTTVNNLERFDVTNVRNFLFDLGEGNDNIFFNGDVHQGAPGAIALNGDLKIFDESGDTNVVIEDALIRGAFWSEFKEGENFLQVIDSRVNGETRVVGGDSMDFVGLFRSAFSGAFHGELGDGNDTFWSGSSENDLIGSRFLDSVDLSFGLGADSTKLDTSFFGDDVRIGTGDGKDSVAVRDSRFFTSQDLRISTGRHRDILDFENVFLKNHAAMIRMGAGSDHVSVKGLIDSAFDDDGGSIGIYGGANKDTIHVENSTLKREMRVNGNFGNDRIYVGSSRMMGGGTGGMSGNQRPVLDVSGGQGTDFTQLIDLIAKVETGNTVDPVSWNDDRKEDRLDVKNLSIVVTQTQEVHDQIAELLESLRRLNELQIKVDVRFVSLTDSFSEEIGIDFDFDPNGTTTSLKYRLNDSANENVFVGRTVFKPDLDIVFKMNSFETNAPQFGGFAVDTASTFGFAILSDIEAFFFIKAASDERADVKLAPKVTLFDGDVASVLDDVTRPFVVSVQPVVG